MFRITTVRMIIGISLVLSPACSTSPTGRRQLMVMPDSQMNSMGSQAFEQLKKEQPIENNPLINQYVRCVASAIAGEAEAETGIHDWEIVVFRSKQVNAFALPGGKIGVYTGILTVAKTPAELAAVLGHEVGHVIAKHGNERVSQGMVVEGGLALADLLTSNNPKRGLIMALLGVGTQFGILLPFSRKQESEADEIGIILMAQAGFDPSQSIALWKNMQANGGKQPPEFLSTHPSHQSRIEDLNARLPQAQDIFHRAEGNGKKPKCEAISKNGVSGDAHPWAYSHRA